MEAWAMTGITCYTLTAGTSKVVSTAVMLPIHLIWPGPSVCIGFA